MSWKTNVEIVYIDRQNFWYNQFLKKYFIINNEFYEIRSECSYCININCKAYMKCQLFLFLAKNNLSKWHQISKKY